MFCLMDVSGSMSEHMKDLAKRFYMLLYVFLKRRYEHVEIVFIRHTDRRRGGRRGNLLPRPAIGRHAGVDRAAGDAATSSARAIRPSDWNIYAAQASDGDNSYADSDSTGRAAEGRDPAGHASTFAYLEVGERRRQFRRHAGIARCGRCTERLRARGAPLAMRKVSDRSEIFPVFRDLFQREAGQERAAP